MSHEYDLFVIGAGSGGVRAARTAASLGARVAIAEDRYMGGTCVNVGCVPKKLYSYAAHFRADFTDVAGFGWSVSPPGFDWAVLRDNKKQEIARLNGIYAELLESSGVRAIDGRATLVNAHSVNVAGSTFSARHILIATGGWPVVPEFPGQEHVITSNEIFDLEVFPGSILIVGGGYIAVEFAGIFAGLGAKTTLCYRREMPLRHFDGEVRTFYFTEMQKHHVIPRMNTDVKEIRISPDGKRLVTFDDGSSDSFDIVFYATGRTPRTEGIGLENTAVRLGKDGRISVDSCFRTDEPSVFALGDVVGHKELTPVALAEGMAVARHLFAGQDISGIDYSLVPTAVFSHPNIATVGLSEEEASEEFEITVFTSDFRHLKHTLSGSDARTFMKIVVDSKTDRVLGMHMVGEEAGEIIQGFASAMQCGITKAQLDTTIGIHPTAAEEFVTMRSPR